jgi:hypothetical protein
MPTPLQLQQIVLARVPFAVKGGGHATNPGFSSTPGVHTSMTRVRDIVIHEDSWTVDIGTGLTWTDVYTYLTPNGLNFVGVAGLTLGGGKHYSGIRFILCTDLMRNYVCGRISLENKSILAYFGHCYCIRTRFNVW